MNIIINFCIFFILLIFLFQKFLKPLLKENISTLIFKKKQLENQFKMLKEDNSILNFDLKDLDDFFLKKEKEEKEMIQVLRNQLIQDIIDYQFLCDEDFKKRKEYLEKSSQATLLNIIKDKIFKNIKSKIDIQKFTLKMKEYCDSL